MNLFKKLNKLISEMNEVKTTNRRLIVFECVGFTYPFYLLMLLKLILIFLVFFADFRGFNVLLFYSIILTILMHLNRSYFNLKLVKEIRKIYPKIDKTNLEVRITPSLRIKNLTIIILLNFILNSILLIARIKKQSFEEIASTLAVSLFLSFIIGFVEYICTIHCKPNILVKPVEVIEVIHEGKKLISNKNLYPEYKELIDDINEKALGYVILNESDEFDLKLINLKSKLNTYNSKFENITLESIFITGLVLSGFFTIITTIDIVILNNTFNEFINKFIHFFKDFTYFAENKKGFINLINLTKNEYFTLISILTLTCSTLYVLVLIMRLRINHIFIKANSALSELIYINEKCKNINDTNYNALNKKREFTMKTSESLINTLNTTNEFISLYRMFGILIFYLIIILSTFQVNFYFGLSISIFTLITHFIKKTEEINKLEKIRNLISKY
jgi:hypothetical protein